MIEDYYKKGTINPIFYDMETKCYKTRLEEFFKYDNFSRLSNSEYRRRHLEGKESYKMEKLYIGDYYDKIIALNINHYFPEGYNILPSYKKVNINNGLELGEFNYNKYIILKIVEELYKVRAIQFLGQDEKRNILKVSIYNYSNYFNTNSEEELQKIYAVGKYIICINPFYKVYDSLDDGIRIESPAETILLDNKDELNYFFERNDNRNIQNLKELGNFFMQKKIYEKAIYYYLECIKIIDKDQSNNKEELNIIILSNLVEAYLKYEYYTNALFYSNKCLELIKNYNDKIKKGGKINEKIELQKQKITFRRIRALKGIRQYYNIYLFLYGKLPKDFNKDNLKIFDLIYKDYNCNIKLNEILSTKEIQDILNLPEFKKIISDLEDKIANEKGIYNFYDLLKMEQKNFKLDCADYYSHKITLDYNDKMGILIKANDHIKKGELIIAEKAVYTINVLSKSINKDTGKKGDIEDDILTYNYLLEEFKKHPNDCKKLNLLYNGINGNLDLEKRFEDIDEPITQDKLTIILKNRHTNRRCVYFPIEISRGLFFISSFFNHSCDNNVCYEGIGDFIFCFAIKDINKGDELTISYISSSENYNKRKEKLDNWGIICKCNYCQHDIKTKDEPYKKRYDAYVGFFQNYKYKANISQDFLSILLKKILELNDFIVQNKEKLTPYEKCYCLLEIFKFYNFTNEIETSKQIYETFFMYEKYEYFFIANMILSNNLRFNNHLIEIKNKDGKKLFNEAKEELIKYFLKMTPYQENAIKEMIRINSEEMSKNK